MHSSKRSWAAGAVALLMALTPAVPVGAMPLAAPQIEKSADMQAIQYRRYDRRDRRGWYHGHRGYRYHRPGYRRHSDGWWYPLAAFGAGAIIGGAISSGRPSAGLSQRHYNWCASRYRTYRPSDNTYVPRAGVRAECRSPYY